MSKFWQLTNVNIDCIAYVGFYRHWQCNPQMSYSGSMNNALIVGVGDVLLEEWLMVLFTLVTRQPYCPGRPKELCFATLSLAMETMGMRLSVVKKSFFGPPGQYGRRVTRANWIRMSFTSSTFSWTVWFLKKTRRRVGREVQHEKASW